jgi:hypothetical protein
VTVVYVVLGDIEGVTIPFCVCPSLNEAIAMRERLRHDATQKMIMPGSGPVGPAVSVEFRIVDAPFADIEDQAAMLATFTRRGIKLGGKL